MLKEKFQKVMNGYKKYVNKTFDVFDDKIMDNEIMDQIRFTKELTNEACDLIVCTAENIDEQQKIIHQMYEEIREIRRLLEES